MRQRKVLSIILILAALSTVFGFGSGATYSPTTAVNYAHSYALTPNSYFYHFEKDCTNFVSQCLAYGGIVSVVDTSFTTQPPFYKNIIMNDNSNSWYMIKKTRSLWPDYFEYSDTWALTHEFWYYHGVCRTGYYRYDNSNYGKQTIISRVQVGDIVQIEDNHSIIITYKSGSTVRYCGHTNNRYDEDISTFFDNWDQDFPDKYVFVISYSD